MDPTSTSFTSALSDALGKIVDWVVKNLPDFLQILIIFVGASIIANLGSKMFAKVLQQTVRADMYPTVTDRNRRLRTLNSIASAVIHTLVWTVAILMILDRLGINTSALIASAGILGVALGFGAQSLVKDFVSGIFIIAENQYRVGDYIEIQNVKGRVKEVTIRTTVIQDSDGSIYHVPNGSIVVTTNRTMGNSTLVIDLSVTADSDAFKVEKIVNKVGKEMAKLPTWKDDIMEPLALQRIKNLSGGVMTLRIIGKVKAGRQLDAKSEFYKAIQKAFKTEKITLK